MGALIRRMPWGPPQVSQLEPLLNREWLVTNGIGGYACGTVAGVVTRRYHGLLVAALPGALGRVLTLAHVSEQLRLPNGKHIPFSGEERTGRLTVHGAEYLSEFRLEMGLPVWQYEVEGVVIEKVVLLPHQQNTVHVTYRLVRGAATVQLELLPSFAFSAARCPGQYAPAGSLPVLGLSESLRTNRRLGIADAADDPVRRAGGFHL